VLTVSLERLRLLARVVPSLLIVSACKNATPECSAATKWDGVKCAASVAPSALASAVAPPSAPLPAPSATASAATATPGMVRISAGDFKMGANDVGPPSKPVHSAHVDSFEMDVTEVTVGQYAACVAAGSCRPANTGLYCNGARPDRTDHPTNCVDFDRAVAYCQWEGKRLPTEEEWEYAALGSDGRMYPWGNESPSKRACWDHTQGTCKVGSYVAGDSPLGLHDMVGNVAEWTSSFYSDDYDKPRDKKNRVVRGGAFFAAHTLDDVDWGSARPATRWLGSPTIADYRFGIRCVR
jgi:formylglycine-generating enzyme required for sulfatase activity